METISKSKRSKSKSTLHRLNQSLISEIKRGRASKVLETIQNGANVNFNRGHPLIVACRHNIDIVKILIEHGADIHIGNEMPLQTAAIFRKLDIFKHLLSIGANPLMRQESILEWISKWDDNSLILQSLVSEHGCNPKTVISSKQGSLHNQEWCRKYEESRNFASALLRNLSPKETATSTKV